MAQPPETPKSVKPKSANPGLFSAFKNLTGTKRATVASGNPSALAAEDTGSSNSAQDLVYTEQTEPPVRSVSRVVDSNVSTNGNEAVHSLQAPYIGGPTDFARLVDVLGPDNPINERLHAARNISQYLNEYPALNVSGIWQQGKDLLQMSDEPSAFDAAYSLLLACARHPSLDLAEKPILFDSIVCKSLLVHPALCFDVLNAISSFGKDLEGLNAAQLASLLDKLLDKSYDLADAARKKARTEKSSSSTASLPSSTEDATLAAIFQFVLNAVKFSFFKAFDESHLDLVIDHVFSICKKTRAESDLRHALAILEAVLVYSVFPKSCLRSCTEVLCSIMCSVETLRAQSLNLILQKMLNSYLGPDTLMTLQAILNENPQKPAKERNSNAVRGAVQTLQEIVTSSDHEALVSPNLPGLFSALDHSLNLRSARLETDVINLLLELFKQQEMAHTILIDEVYWVELSNIIVHLSSGVHALESASATGTEKPMSLEKDNFLAPKFADGFQQIAHHLIAFCESADVDRKIQIIHLLLQVVRYLNDSQAGILVNLYIDERLIFPAQEHWLKYCLELQANIVRDNWRSPLVRLSALEAIRNAHSIAAASNFSEAQELAMALLATLQDTNDSRIVGPLTDFAVDVAVGTSNIENFNAIIHLLNSVLFLGRQDTKSPSRSSSSHEKLSFPTVDSLLQYANTSDALISKALVTIFLRSINRSADKTQGLFNLLIALARSPEPAPEARIIALKVLCRLRADYNYALYIVADTASEGIAAALCRTVETAAPQEVSEKPSGAPVARESSTKRKAQSTSPSSTSTPARSVGATGRMTRPTPPLWMYPGPKGLPEDPPFESSHLLSSHDVDSNERTSDSESKVTRPLILKIGLWLELILDVLQREELEWETYSYIIVHLGPQLANRSLFADSVPQIKLLRNILCDLLQNKKFHEPPAFTNLKKSDVANCLYHVLTTLVSFHHHFAKSEEDEIVKTFVFGIGSWERTSEVCIHALSVCCHETPMSFVKYLNPALQQMIQIIAQSTIAVHILEFLAGLARLPTLFRNFREEEFRSVFGICFRYLQYVRDQRARSGQASIVQSAKSASTASTARQQQHQQHHHHQRESETNAQIPALGEVLPQYVYFLTYHVMVFWFISLRMPDRARHLAWIRSNLLYTNDSGQQEMEEQSQSTIDLMHRVAYSDRDETLPNPDFAKPSDGPVLTKHFLVGLSILTVDIGTWTGVSHITIRRPSGTKYAVSRPQVTALPRHQVPIYPIASNDSGHPEDYVGVTPDDIVQSLYSPLSVSPELASLTDGPISLPDDEATKRAIAAFDRISALDGHKVGIIYIGEGQTLESVILANVMGSSDYVNFLNGIGTLSELQGATFNTQGLDREYGSDGKFTYCWRDRVSELVFHVTTMMPTDLDRDPQCSLKKRHIGNDYVNIIWNNSGLPFDVGTFPSDFNFVNIVITPEARASFIDTRLKASRLRTQQQQQHQSGAEASIGSENSSSLRQSEEPTSDDFYRVTVLTKPGLPAISPASEAKVVSAKSLPSFVRLLALNASVFALVWANRAGGEHVSSWRSRLREIVRLRERNSSAIGKEARNTEISSSSSTNNTSNNNNPNPNNASTNTTSSSTQAQVSSAAERSTATRESGLLRRASAATFFSEAGTTNRSSGFSNSADWDGRTLSSGSHDL